MNTTELIELLKSVEFGTSGRPREISIRLDSEGIFLPYPKLNVVGTGDGIAGAVECIFFLLTSKCFGNF